MVVAELGLAKGSLGVGLWEGGLAHFPSRSPLARVELRTRLALLFFAAFFSAAGARVSKVFDPAEA